MPNNMHHALHKKQPLATNHIDLACSSNQHIIKILKTGSLQKPLKSNKIIKSMFD